MVQKIRNLEAMKEQEIWLAQLPEYMGYGLYVVGTSEKEAMRVLRKEFQKWKKDLDGEYYGRYLELIENCQQYCDKHLN